MKKVVLQDILFSVGTEIEKAIIGGAKYYSIFTHTYAKFHCKNQIKTTFFERKFL